MPEFLSPPPDGVELSAAEWHALSDVKQENLLRRVRWEGFRRANIGRELLAPYVMEHRLEHKLVTGAKRGCNHPVEGARGGRCGRGQWHPSHWGYPPSYRSVGSGDQLGYRSIKQHWDAMFVDLLEGSELPKGLGRVLVEGEMCVPRRQDLDQGNLRFFAEKCIGDALQQGGWLANDSWRQFSFGNYTLRYAKDQAWCRFLLFPAWEETSWEELELNDPARAPEGALF